MINDAQLTILMTILDGKGLSQILKSEVKHDLEALMATDPEKYFRRPHLSAILVGDNPASRSYIRNKVKSCEAVGFESSVIELPEDVTQEELMEVVYELNENPNIDGYIVQLPTPPQINDEMVLLAIDPKKDVDGFHPTNFGRMAQGLPAYIPATPYGILLLIERYGIHTSGMDCVIIGRSNIVGTPMSILLSRKGEPGNCTVTLTHSRTKDLAEKAKQADLLIAAIGIPKFVTKDMVKPGAVIIDVGINQIEDNTRKSGRRLVGDVDYEAVQDIAGYMTPVPGGVGPLTVMGLILNTFKSYKKEVYG